MSKNRILFIDDEASILDIVRARLEELGVIVDTADGGKAGLELFLAKQSEYIGIICDIEMPDMKGDKVLKEIRSVDGNIPFIFFTGYGSRERMMSAVQYGVRDFIDKPNIEDLASAVGDLLRNPLDPLARSSEEELSDYQRLIEEMEEGD